MTDINRWILSCQNRVANIWYDQNAVFGLNPAAGGQPPSDANIVTLQDLGSGNIALRCGGGYNAYASVRLNVYLDYYPVQFQAETGAWISEVGANETFQAIPTGDGYFALYSPTFGAYVTINPTPYPNTGNCNALIVSTRDLGSAARFTATGLDRNSIFDFLEVSNNASGFSFAGVNLANQNLSGNNLSLCDFRQVASLDGCVLGFSLKPPLPGANLQQACFAGLHLAGLQIWGADCTGADFTGCDFTSLRPRTGAPPPVLAHADLTEANLTGCDLSGTELTAVNFSGLGVTLFTGVYQQGAAGGGIGGYNLASPADRVFAYDYDGTGKLDHLVCYRPGTGTIWILKKTSDADSLDAFAAVYHQGDPGNGIGGYSLGGPADRVFAYDYDGTGKLDHLVCYQPGTGTIWILKKTSDADSPDAFTAVYQQFNPATGLAATAWAVRRTGCSPTTTTAPASSTIWSATGLAPGPSGS